MNSGGIRIKICCIANPEEAQLALNAGAAAIGLVSEMPSGPGVIEDRMITEICKRFNDRIDTFLLTSKQCAEEIIDQHRQIRSRTIQIVDYLPLSAYKKLRAGLPGIHLVQVVHVTGIESINIAKKYSEYADALLLDSGDPKAKIRSLGGTGRTHDWNLSARIVRDLSIPVWLAGGLNNMNAAEAIVKVQPFGIDLCSSIRSNGMLNKEKLFEFFESIPGGC